jgi:hypothetical protein
VSPARVAEEEPYAYARAPGRQDATRDRDSPRVNSHSHLRCQRDAAEGRDHLREYRHISCARGSRLCAAAEGERSGPSEARQEPTVSYPRLLGNLHARPSCNRSKVAYGRGLGWAAG